MTGTRSDEETARGERSPDASMSLLNHLMSHPLDEDYALAAEDRQGGTGAHTTGGMAGLFAVLAVFGLLLVTMLMETNRAAPAVEEERGQLIERIEDESQELQALRQAASSLETSVAGLEDRVLSRSRLGQKLQARLRRLESLSGVTPVSGPGLVITVDDADNAASQRAGQVLDTDLQTLVNALWVAGAEAVSIDGQRITSRTAIRGAGDAITVNYRSLTRPYVVRAIGDPDTLPARLLETEGGRAWLDLQVNFDVEFTTETRRNITVPGRAATPTRYAEVSGGAR